MKKFIIAAAALLFAGAAYASPNGVTKAAADCCDWIACCVQGADCCP